MCLSIQWWRQRNKEGSRCLQLQTRLWGGVDCEGACRVCVSREFREGYRGSGGGRRGGELWLKGAFPLKCLPAYTPANTITSLVGSASWTNEGLRNEGRGFDVLGSWLLVFSLPLSFSACPTSKIKGELRSRCFEACIYTEYTLFTPFSIPHVSFASAFALYKQRSISLSLYPTKHTKSPYFIHIIMMSIKVGNFYLSLLPLSACLSLISALSGCHYSGGSRCVAMHVSMSAAMRGRMGKSTERERKQSQAVHQPLSHTWEKQWQEIPFCSSSRVKW